LNHSEKRGAEQKKERDGEKEEKERLGEDKAEHRTDFILFKQKIPYLL